MIFMIICICMTMNSVLYIFYAFLVKPPGRGWPNEEIDGGGYHSSPQHYPSSHRTLNQMDEYMTKHRMSPYYLPQSPTSPVSPISSSSYSSEQEAPSQKLVNPLNYLYIVPSHIDIQSYMICFQTLHLCGWHIPVFFFYHANLRFF